MNLDLLNSDIQNFITKNLNSDISKLLFKGSPFEEIHIQDLVEQIEAKKRCKTKLPIWFMSENIYFPNKLNIEQTSSEITAKYKSNLITGNSIIDITGGFGVDTYYFSKRFENIIHCELNKELSKIVAHNFKQLEIDVKTISQDGLDYLEETNQQFDWIYVDPSRRTDRREKVFLLKDCLPNIPENLNLLFNYSDNILIKASPILDISSAIKELNYVKEVHVVAVENEVKELLFMLKNDCKEAINLKTVNIKKNEIESFNAVLKSKPQALFSEPKNFLYEPNSAILKAGLFNEVSNELNTYKLNKNSHLYSSNDIIKFPGRRFEILERVKYDRKEILKYLPDKKANITTRNFPETVAQIRKKTKIKEGGNLYLFFTTDIHKKPIVLICEKV